MKNVTFTNLKASGKDSFLYRTAEMGDIVEVEIEYSANESLSRRGIWVRVTPMKLEQRDGYVSRSFALFSGFTVFVERLQRSKPSALLAKAERLDPQVKAIAAVFILEQAKAKSLVREIFGIEAPASAAPAQYVPAGGVE